MNLHEALNFAHQCMVSNKLDPAEDLCNRILVSVPDQPDALRFLALIFRQKGLLPQAVDPLRRLLAVRPADPDTLTLLAQTLRELNQLDEALDLYQQIVQINSPNTAEIYARIGNIHKLLGQSEQAIEAYQNALALNPSDALAWYNMGISLQDQSLFEQATKAYEKAIALDPDFFLAHVNLGNALQSLGQYDNAIEACQKAISINPNSILPYNNLINACNATGQFEKALEYSAHAMKIDPHNAPYQSIVRYNLANAYNGQGLLDQAVDGYTKSMELNPAFPPAHSNLILSLHYSIRHCAADIFREERLWNSRHAPPLSSTVKPFAVDPDPNRKLRVGFVSPDFRDHPISRFITPLFANLDPDLFEIHAYNDIYKSDSITHAIHSLVPRWTEIFALSNEQFVQQVQNDRIDILFDLASHSGCNRLGAFAQKPAPIQISWLAYCGSTGLDAIDYRISDPYMDPPGMFDSYYCEKTLLLPDCYWCYSEPPSSPEPSFPPSPDPVFGCLNNFRKINDVVLSLWARNLNLLPKSTLFIHANPPVQSMTLDKLRSMGVSPTQIRFIGRLDTPQYFAMYNQIHIALDPFPFNGGTTTCDALWMGVPVVSRVSTDRAVGRAGLSILSQVGLSDLATDSDEAYINTAVQLAQNTPRLRDLRLNLRQTLKSSPLMDAPRFAKNFGDLLRNIWIKHNSGNQSK